MWVTSALYGTWGCVCSDVRGDNRWLKICVNVGVTVTFSARSPEHRGCKLDQSQDRSMSATKHCVCPLLRAWGWLGNIEFAWCNDAPFVLRHPRHALFWSLFCVVCIGFVKQSRLAEVLDPFLVWGALHLLFEGHEVEMVVARFEHQGPGVWLRRVAQTTTQTTNKHVCRRFWPTTGQRILGSEFFMKM